MCKQNTREPVRTYKHVILILYIKAQCLLGFECHKSKKFPTFILILFYVISISLNKINIFTNFTNKRYWYNHKLESKQTAVQIYGL